MAAQEAGFRESGISSISEDASGRVQTVMVAVRTTGLSFDNLVGQVEDDKTIASFVEPESIQIMVSHANEHFVHNASRTKRFTEALMQRFTTSQDDNWEQPNVRKARMREEGLKRRNELQRQKNSQSEGDGTLDEVLDLELISSRLPTRQIERRLSTLESMTADDNDRFGH